MKTLMVASSGKGAVVVCDALHPPAEILPVLEEHDVFAQRFIVSYVISVLDPLVAIPWATMRHPLVMNRTHRGWSSVVVLSSQRNDVGVYIDRLCRELRALRGDGAVLPDALIGTLLEGEYARSSWKVKIT